MEDRAASVIVVIASILEEHVNGNTDCDPACNKPRPRYLLCTTKHDNG